MIVLLCATFPSHETAVITSVEEARNEATDKRDVVEQGRIEMVPASGIMGEIRIEVTDRDLTIEEEGKGADREMGDKGERGTKVEMAARMKAEMAGELATVRKTGGIQNAREAETGIDHGEVVYNPYTLPEKATKSFGLDEQPARRSERPQNRSRSRSPRPSRTSTARKRSPIRSPPPKPSSRDSPSLNAPVKPTPPTGPRSQKPHPPSTVPSQTNGSPSANGTKHSTTGPSIETSKPPDAKVTASASAKEDMDVDEDPEVALMRQMMGFSGFRSTKQTKVPGNNVYGVRKEKKTEYRQYMNRVGGFNRPLSPSR